MLEQVMVIPSSASTFAFVALVLGLCGLFVTGVARSGSRTQALWAAAGCAAWLTLTAAIPASGLLRRPLFPPPVVFFFAASMLVALGAALSPLGARLARGIPVAALVAVQGFRLPLELILRRWHIEGVLPVQMTFEGHNFDIVSGVTALALGAWLQWGPASRAQRPEGSRLMGATLPLTIGRRRFAAAPAIWAFNLIGTGLLVAVSTIAVLSSPLPIRHYLNDPPVLLAFYAPYSWIVPFCVGGALFGHVVLFRWLLSRAPAAERKVRAHAAAAPM